MFGKKRKMQPLLCGMIGDVDIVGGQRAIVTGTVTGHLYIWLNHRVSKTVTAHDAPIYAICPMGKRYITGGKEGLVKIWSNDFLPILTLNLQTFSPQPETLSIHSLRVNFGGSRMSIGMRSGEVYEVTLQTQSCLMLLESHSRLQLHALAVNPNNSDEYATAGDDGFVRVWSIEKRVCSRRLSLEAAVRSLAWSPDGTKIICGVGGDPSITSKDGAFFAIEANRMEILFEDRKAKKLIADIKFSPTAEVIAMASRDGKVYLHSSVSFALIHTVVPPVRRCVFAKMDFTVDGAHLRVATSPDEIFYVHVSNAAEADVIASMTVARDFDWLTCSCPVTWLSQGIIRPIESAMGAQGAMSKTGVLAVTLNPRRTLIAATYQDGEIRVYRYPCVAPEGAVLTVPGVATQATNITFSSDGKYLIVLDALTRSVLQFVVISK